MDNVDLLTNKLIRWGEGAVQALPNLVAAVLVLVAFWLLAKLARKTVAGALHRTSDNEAVTNLLASMTNIAVLATGFFIALSILELKGAVTSLLAGVGIIGLALGFAFQDIAANFISGVLLAIRRPFHVGDTVSTNDFMGTIEEITLRATIGRNFEGQIVTLPNKDVLQEKIKNYSRSNERRVDLEVGVSYGDDLDKVEKVALEAVASLEHDEQRGIELYYESFGGSSINFRLRIWIHPDQHSFLKTRHEAIKRIQHAFNENGITIPFPIQTLDFSKVGGAQLQEFLPTVLAGDKGATPKNGDSENSSEPQPSST